MNINPAARRILCFGDSNTWGYAPDTNHERYAADIRWTGVLQKALGDGFEVIEEGLNSRRISSDDPRLGKEGRNALSYILPCLDTHDPIDTCILFLGTNDLKPDMGLSAAQIAENLGRLISTIQNRKSQCIENHKVRTVIVVPPRIDENTPYTSKDGKYKGTAAKALALRTEYAKIAGSTHSILVDIQDQLETGGDGIHLTAASHTLLGAAIARVIHEAAA